jgi:hypothetical protein
MSEKKIPEVIWIPNYSFAEYLKDEDMTFLTENVNIRTRKEEVELSSIHHQEYILKQTHDKEVADLKAEIERLKDCIRLGHECIKIWIKHNNEEIDVMDREFLLQSEQLLK